MPSPSPRPSRRRSNAPARRKSKPGARPAASTPVSSIMTRQVVTVTADTSVETAVALMVDGELSRMPVVDELGRPVGMFSKSDVVREQYENGDTAELLEAVTLPGKNGIRYSLQGMHLEVGQRTVGDLMTRVARCIAETESVAKAAELLTSHHLHGLPVVGERGELVGFLSALDVVTWVAAQA